MNIHLKKTHISIGLYQKPFKIFLKDFIYLFLERRQGREKERERNMCGCLLHSPFLGPARTQASNQRPFGLQAGTQSTEPHQPGPKTIKYVNCVKKKLIQLFLPLLAFPPSQ